MHRALGLIPAPHELGKVAENSSGGDRRLRSSRPYLVIQFKGSQDYNMPCYMLFVGKDLH